MAQDVLLHLEGDFGLEVVGAFLGQKLCLQGFDLCDVAYYLWVRRE